MVMIMVDRQLNSSFAVEKLNIRFPEVQPRYERKFRLPINLSETIKSRIYSFGFRKTYSNRIINSKYFDTQNLDFGRDNIDGERFRLKVRVRWYNLCNNNKHSTLEIKCKHGLLGYKYKFKVKSINDDEIADFISQEIGILLSPNCITRYNRFYFENSFGIRATLDENLVAKNTNFNSRFYSPLGYSVLEFKYATHLDHFYRETIQSRFTELIPLRLNKSSKYVESLRILGIT